MNSDTATIPLIETYPHIDLIQALTYIEKTYEKGFYDKCFDVMCDRLDIKNDTCVKILPKWIIECPQYEHECFVKFIKYMELENYEKVYLDVSW